jgi:hypothetical protein
MAQALRMIAQFLESVSEIFEEMLSRIFERRKEILFAIAFVYLSIGAITFALAPEIVADIIQRLSFVFGKSSAVPLFISILLLVVVVFFFGLRPLFRESPYDEYGKKRSDIAIARELYRLRLRALQLQRRGRQPNVSLLRRTTAELERRLGEGTTKPQDFSSPDKIFAASRQRLIDESIRIDKISRRNLYFGIVFSGFALSILGSPLVVQAAYFILSVNSNSIAPPPFVFDGDVTKWFTQSYLPRFAVALLLQFVGFFFLRLYVANELDLKHNKNEITNIESKMIGLQFGKSSKNAKIREIIVKTLSETERNFVIKKNEKIASMETLAEYNDIKSLVEKLVDKLPSADKKSGR